MHPFRVFLSYTAQDQRLLDSVVEVLRDLGLCPWWDKKLGPGRLFLDEIKQRIATAHLFVPLLTSTSSFRPWVHQETGFALGINVPVLKLRRVSTVGCHDMLKVAVINSGGLFLLPSRVHNCKDT